jgi:DNA invertase Pin-like site-specific DNA recombinase
MKRSLAVGSSNQWNDMGKLMEDQFLSLLSYVADHERKKIRQRQAVGIAVAKEKGKHLGRPKMTLNTLSKLDLKKNTFYKIVSEYEEQRDAS